MISNKSHPILTEVEKERTNQDLKWGEQNHPDGTGVAVMGSKVIIYRDMAKSRCDEADEVGKCTWEHILTEEYYEAMAESDPELLRAELIQVAAVAASWIEAIDRRQLDV